AKREKYHIIFLDPPYNSGLLPASLKALHEAELFAPGAYIICETDCDLPVKATRLRKDEDIAAEYVLKDVFGGSESLRDKYEVLRSALYGRTRITLLTPAKADSATDGDAE
ncbi:MAG: RsmD family RNA methyltransferase, partial [Eubacteriales bacterium]